MDLKFDLSIGALVQGAFFMPTSQAQSYDPEEGLAHVLGPVTRFLFQGIIWKEPDTRSPRYGELRGRMYDAYGHSSLSEISIEPDSFSFKKKYNEHSDTILYHFVRKESGVWVGEYTMEHYGDKGVATCYLQSIHSDFFPSLLFSTHSSAV